MNRNPADRHDHETLSALFDDALEADAARFAVRRLAHDRDWQARVSRWQMTGDVLRGQCPLPLPAEFAARVAAALQADARAKVAPVPRVPLRRWPWLGGAALAASVAVVALLAWPDAPAPPPVAPVAGAGPATPVGQTLPSAAAAAAPATTAVAGTTVAARMPVPRARSRAMRDELLASRHAVASASSAIASTVPAMATGDAADPFGVQGHVIPNRPWPRDRFGLDAGDRLTAAYQFSEAAAPARDDPFRAAGHNPQPASAHREHPARADAPPQPPPPSHDAPP